MKKHLTETANWLQQNVAKTASTLGAISVIGASLVWASSQSWFIASRGYVQAYVANNNIEQSRRVIEPRIALLETDLQAWTIEFINLNERRSQLAREIDELNNVIEKDIEHGEDDSDEHRAIVSIRDRMVRDLAVLMTDNRQFYYALSVSSELESTNQE